MSCCIGNSELPVGIVTGPRANAGSGGLEACPWSGGESVTAGEGARVVPTSSKEDKFMARTRIMHTTPQLLRSKFTIIRLQLLE